MKITVELNPHNKEECDALITFLKTFQPVNGESEAPEEEVKKTTKKAAKKEKEASVSIDTIRELVASNTDPHRKEIKAKLTELGAKNVTTLEESKYDEFHAFLTAL